MSHREDTWIIRISFRSQLGSERLNLPIIQASPRGPAVYEFQCRPCSNITDHIGQHNISNREAPWNDASLPRLRQYSIIRHDDLPAKADASLEFVHKWARESVERDRRRGSRQKGSHGWRAALKVYLLKSFHRCPP